MSSSDDDPTDATAWTMSRRSSGHVSTSGHNRPDEELSDPELEPEAESEHFVWPENDLLEVAVDQKEAGELSEYERSAGQSDLVLEILQQQQRGKETFYDVLFDDGHADELSLHDLLKLEGSDTALQLYRTNLLDAADDEDFTDQSDAVEMSSTRPNAKRQREHGYVDFDEVDDMSDQDLDSDEPEVKRPRLRLRVTRSADHLRRGSDHASGLRRSTRASFALQRDHSRQTRSSRAYSARSSQDGVIYDLSDDEAAFLQSDIAPKRISRASANRPKSRYVADDGTVYDKAPQSRRSGRSTRHQGAMEEIGEDQIHRSDSEPLPVAPPKIVGVKEIFKTLPRTDQFRARHVQQCDRCGQGANFAPLIYCQGCVLAYHKACLEHRSNREHVVTKVGQEDFVLQCRRCVRAIQKKDANAPDLSKCQDCKAQGLSCKPFRARKTPMQEQKDRESNGGEDPIVPVPQILLNNALNVLFRCTGCHRAFHFEHLPPRKEHTGFMDVDEESIAALRAAEYSQDWTCQECLSVPAKIQTLVAWKPLDEDTYEATRPVDEINEDQKAYLIRYEGLSYFRAAWMPGPWVWGVTAAAMRKAFSKREEAQAPKMRTEDAIPEEYLRTDIVLDVKYTSIVDVEAEEIDKARIREVKEALIKFKGLTYEEAVWEVPPAVEDVDRWIDFVTAYNDWVLGKYTHLPKEKPLKSRLEKARGLDFATKLEKKKQPESMIGGELMKYQMDGLNWLYYKWYTQHNAILADEMGLGKTIQIIGLLATLVSDWNCFPFLIVVPNSTCANWRREIKHWAPSLRVVAYFGYRTACEMAYRYELFPRGSKELRCHIVVTSYEAVADDANKRFFRSVPWQGLIVDEGQRLKNDKSQLYTALMGFKIPFRILLTGTPLQNNQRELYNLLQFLDGSYDAAAMEAEFSELDNGKLAELHDRIRPFFLRRTKAQVLTFLPPMAQIIVPVSMSLVQKKLYRSILAKNPDLLRALFKDKRDLKGSEKGSLNNILMQLRKCLCHPFVYNQEIEERNVPYTVSHRNLVSASGKLQLLEMLLPKLKDRGHRVLIFSQFLGMLTMVEDFLDGLGMAYQRLDGTMSSLQKQKRIDEFNAPNSELFVFLLSTRSGGVGINLATADTVIILDPDWNPHQDIQALSRAHRIGQKKKVLCFQLVTRASAEEKIMQIGRKKMALDHVMIDQMDAEDASEQDLQSVLRHGAAELFNDDGSKDITYDGAEIEKLLDRSQIEDTKAGKDKSAESQFSFARVWANNELEDSLPVPEIEEQAPDPGVWDKILKERERAAAAEAAAAQEALGRGRRAKQAVDYATKHPAHIPAEDGEEEAESNKILKKLKDDDGSDTDFHNQSDSDSAAEPDPADHIEMADGDAEVAGLTHTPKGKARAKQTGKQSLVVKLKSKDKSKLGAKVKELFTQTPKTKSSPGGVKTVHRVFKKTNGLRDTAQRLKQAMARLKKPSGPALQRPAKTTGRAVAAKPRLASSFQAQAGSDAYHDLPTGPLTPESMVSSDEKAETCTSDPQDQCGRPQHLPATPRIVLED